LFKIKLKAKNTLSAVELNKDEVLEFTLLNHQVIRIEILETKAEIFQTTLKEILKPEKGAITNYRFWMHFKVNGVPATIEREVSTQKSFYEPFLIEGVFIWLDAVKDIFAFLLETHGDCKPKKDVRLAILDASLGRICPEILHPWCPLPEGTLNIKDCFRGEDCWLGAYDGVDAHGGLDINHPRGTPLWAPFDIHDHYYFNCVAAGHNNNRWRGVHRFPNGAEWVIQSHHQITLLVDEHTPFKKGHHYSDGAGVWVGRHDHTHFVFKIYDCGELTLLDPWILFWQMYRDQRVSKSENLSD